MAARAPTRRSKPAASRRRPAARRRRPAPRRGGSRIRWDRVGRVALTLVLAAVLYSYLNPAIDFVKTYTATTAAKEKLHELQDANRRLHNRIQSSEDPVVVSREARAKGMVAAEETPIILRGLEP